MVVWVSALALYATAMLLIVGLCRAAARGDLGALRAAQADWAGRSRRRGRHRRAA